MTGMDDKIKIFQRGENILRQTAKEVPVEEIKSKKIRAIVKKMEEAVLEHDEALAIAAPQVGERLQIFVLSEWAKQPDSQKPKSEFKNIIFINPKILKMSQKKAPCPESCLSAPEYCGEVQRAEKIKVEAYDKNGKKFICGASGLMAQAIQHEIDHLNGTLFIDKASKLARMDNKTPERL